MPFNVFDHAWANARFGDSDLRATNRFSQTDPAGNRFTKNGVRYVGEQFLGRFDGSDLDGWYREVKAVTNHALARLPTESIRFAVMWARISYDVLSGQVGADGTGVFADVCGHGRSISHVPDCRRTGMTAWACDCWPMVRK